MAILKNISAKGRTLSITFDLIGAERYAKQIKELVGEECEIIKTSQLHDIIANIRFVKRLIR